MTPLMQIEEVKQRYEDRLREAEPARMARFVGTGASRHGQHHQVAAGALVRLRHPATAEAGQ